MTDNTETPGNTEELNNDEDPGKNGTAALQLMLIRLQADFDNFRKRNASLRQETRDETKKEFLALLLPIYDNFHRALQSADETETNSAMRLGLEGILKQLETLLTSQGLQQIEAVPGIDFNPELHEATGAIPGDDSQSNTIAQVLLPGFSYKNSVVRPTQVLVYS